MTVQKLIDYLNNVEDKNQTVCVSDYTFDQVAEVNYALEIKSVSDKTMYPKGICLLAPM